MTTLEWVLALVFGPFYLAFLVSVIVRMSANSWFDAKLRFTEKLLGLQNKQPQQQPQKVAGNQILQ